MHLVIEVGYSKKLLLPVAAGLKVIEGLADARVLVETYGKPSEIKPMEDGDLKFSLLSQDAVDAMNINKLLGNSIDGAN